MLMENTQHYDMPHPKSVYISAYAGNQDRRSMSNGEDYRSLSWHASQIEIWTIWTLCGLQDDKESTLARYKYSEPSTECQRQAYDGTRKSDPNSKQKDSTLIHTTNVLPIVRGEDLNIQSYSIWMIWNQATKTQESTVNLKHGHRRTI